MLRKFLHRHLHLHRPYHRYTYSIGFLEKRRPNRYASTLGSSDESIATILAKEPGTTTGSDNIIRVTGSVRTIRKQKHRCFLEIGDGSTSRPLQAILEPQHAEGYVAAELVQRRHPRLRHCKTWYWDFGCINGHMATLSAW